MWLFLGLFAALSATAFLDAGESTDSREDDEDEADQSETRSASENNAVAAFSDLLQELSFSENASDSSGASLGPVALTANPDAGLFDDLHERIHSSDLAPRQRRRKRLSRLALMRMTGWLELLPMTL